jgi:hypothetical protein
LTTAYAIGVPKTVSINNLDAYWNIIISNKSCVETVPAKAINTKGNESNQYATAELPIVRTHNLLPLVHFFIFSINQALLNSPNKKPVNEAITMRGT